MEWIAQKIRLAESLLRSGFLEQRDPRPEHPSPFNFNFRMQDHPTNPGTMRQTQLQMITEALYAETCVAHWIPRGICGLPDAGKSFGKELAAIMAHPPGSAYTLEKIREPEGKRLTNLTVVEHRSPVLLVDDVLGRGRSKQQALNLFREAKLEVVGLVVVVDLERGGRQALEHAGCPVASIFTASGLFQFWHRYCGLPDERFVPAMQHLAWLQAQAA